MRRPSALTLAAALLAWSLPLAAPVAADESTGVCDVKAAVGDDPPVDDVLDVRIGEDLWVLGYGFPAGATLTIEFSTMGRPPEFYSTTALGDGTFTELFGFSGDDPAAPESWLLAVYDPADIGSCIDFVNLWLHPATPFTDIDGSIFRGDIAWLYQAEITAGCTATRFCPDASVTREQMASFLSRALSLPATSLDFFSDDESSIHEGAINRLAAAGITGGCDASRYCPGATVTREQMASFLSRALGLPATSVDFFSDDESTIHEGAINRLAAAGITGGCDATRFCPGAGVTRGQMAAFLHRALD